MLKGTGILREQNKRTALSYIRKMKATSRKDLAETMSVSKNTVSLIVDELLSDQVVVEMNPKKPGEKGRPKQIIKLNKNGYKSIGVSVFERSIKYVVLNYYGELIEEVIVPYNTDNFDATDLKLKELIEILLKKHVKVIGVGISIPGIVNTNKKTVHNSIRLGWENKTFRCVQMIDIPIIIQNNVNMTALSAIENEGSQLKGSFFYVQIGNGVGGSYVTNNSIINGASWTAGEIGHVSVDLNGPVCICGQRGCLEQLIGLKTFKKFLENQGDEQFYKNMVSSQIDKMSSSIEQTLSQYGEYLGKAIIPVIHLVNPNYIIISTPYEMFDCFKKACLDYMENNALTIPYTNTSIIFSKSTFNNSVGAGLAVIHEYESAYY